MKKTILATLIATASFNAAAEMSIPSPDPIQPIDQPIVIEPIDVIVEPVDPGFGVDPIDVVIDPVDPGFGVDPIDVVIDPIDPGYGNEPIKERGSNFIQAFNKRTDWNLVESDGSISLVAPDGTASFTVARKNEDGEWEMGHRNEELKNEFKAAAVDYVKGNHGDVIIEPIDTIIDPIDPGFGINPIELTNEQKAELFNNKAMLHGKDAHIQQSANGEFVLVWNDPETGEKIGLPLDENFDLDTAKDIAKDILVGGAPIVDPIVPGGPTPVEPLPGNPNMRDENIAKFNEHLNNYSNGNAYIETQKDGSKTLTFTDQVSGEQRSINLSELDAEQLNIIKTAMVEHYNENNTSPIVDPTPGEPTPVEPIPGEETPPKLPGEKLSKVRDHIDSRKAEIKEKIEEHRSIEDPVIIPDGKVAKAVAQKLEERGEEAYGSIKELYAQGASAMASIENDVQTLFGEIDRLDEKMDSVMAGVHAVNNARPYLSGEGQTAIGVGVGYAGESGAVALGAAHSFTENWSASATLNVTTGSYSEVSGGAGVQYVF
ncbi:YadA C-terminal domain-containing protein [Vibrio sp. Isolate30]|uniref:YadA C-terminal domain-containing protein n=1 Tax=Vibrio sp. Isolate30 TaxID=2908536 RepID=UPI001EFE5F51|nr:YadA C-terminal domain-containing protein [Vibrio sp. Isolate30]MCG9629495.1 YadA-like family protein [Vibrio sp. Isolate30]